MQQHIATCKASGQTVAEYCASHQIKAHQYYYWQKKLQQRQSGKFINIAPMFSNAPVSITFTNGNQICFTALPPVEYVKQLMA